MLDSNTKRRIDTARDILVGKVPDPKSQVEQITIALIYKFMDDMDAESEEFGGKRSFFAGEFARYGWTKLMRAGLGGHETLNLYAEGITKMPENPGIPPLFRDIFNNAYLPYRDPETLRAFLKVIDEFTYDHSERLGDAFEYLLSVLGSQGDAGQFRTPRHIIDFIVAIIEPKQGETVLDPACGTAGFLISSYKHILAANTDPQGDSTLTPDEKGQLAANCKGYDISPDMVRLSLVNMYLHGFADPHIFEYDTLTSEERWDEYADVILANPPFMSPKGGIRPHNRFSVQSKRSEVLFVDYMAEHLMPSGRAGIIVPEGIIFQSQNAYKRLRKMLVEEYLVAVISLPAGVFNPYSGVKTSILILDKSLAKKTDLIAFFKVENDGFDLGAQRHPIDKNDMPQVQIEIGKYLQRLQAGVPPDSFQPALGLIVEKEKISSNGEYSLSGERYRAAPIRDAVFPYVRLDAIAEIAAGNSAPQGDQYFKGGEFPFIRTSDVGAVHLSDDFIGAADKVNQRAIDELRLRLFPAGTILFPKSGASTFLNHRVVMGEMAYVSSHLACIICDGAKVLPKYIYSLLCCIDARQITPDQAYPSLRLTEIGSIEGPIPPLEVQKEIVAEIEGYQKVVDGARAVIDNYRPHIVADPDWPMVKIGETCNLINGRAFKPQDWEDSDSGGLPIVRIQNLNTPDNEFNYYTGKVRDRFIINEGQLLFSWSGSRGTSFGAHIWNGGKAILNQHIFKVGYDKAWATKLYLFHTLNEAVAQVEENLHGGVGLVHITKGNLERIKIPLPPLEVQKEVVAEIEAEQALVAANRELIDRFEKKIQATIARVWDEDESTDSSG